MPVAALPLVFSGLSAGAAVYGASQSARQASISNARSDRLSAYQEAALARTKVRAEAMEPCITAWLEEACSEPKPVARTAEVVSRAQVSIRADASRAKEKLRRCTPMYCAPSICSQSAMIDVAASALSIEASIAETRREESRVRLLRQQRRDNIFAAARFSEGSLAEANNASRSLLDYYSRQSATSSNALAGSLKTLGYLASRAFNTTDKPTAMPNSDQFPVNGFDGASTSNPFEPTPVDWDAANAADQQALNDVFQSSSADYSQGE